LKFRTGFVIINEKYFCGGWIVQESLLHLILHLLPMALFGYISIVVNLRIGINKKFSRLLPNDKIYFLIWFLVCIIAYTSISSIFRIVIESEAIINIINGTTLGIIMYIGFPFEQIERMRKQRDK
jgi:hypothetical protein